jgi:hypothetical protein
VAGAPPDFGWTALARRRRPDLDIRTADAYRLPIGDAAQESRKIKWYDENRPDAETSRPDVTPT